MKKILLLLPFVWMASFVQPTYAGLGVGIGTGKIVIDQILKPGTIYNLPPVSILNTGDVTSKYGVGISHRENQPELTTDPSWYTFEPSSFSLEPGQAQNVKVTLTLPIKTVPGKYFAFIEGHPITDATGASIGIAAASKLYFEVAPSNIFVGLYYRLLTFWQTHANILNPVAGVIGLAIVILFVTKNFKITKK